MSNFESIADDLNFQVPALAMVARDLCRRFDAVQHRIMVGNREFELLHPRSADDLIDDDEFNRDERLPYWAEIWPSALVLAARIATECGASNGKHKRMLELGCGSGLAVVAGLEAGFQVTAIDYYSAALEFVGFNASLNRLPAPHVRLVDWRRYPADLRDFDLVVAADVLYENGYCSLIAQAFKQSLTIDGIGLLTDPQRVKAKSLAEECRRHGLQLTRTEVVGPLSVPGADGVMKQTVDVFELRRTI